MASAFAATEISPMEVAPAASIYDNPFINHNMHRLNFRVADIRADSTSAPGFGMLADGARGANHVRGKDSVHLEIVRAVIVK